MRSTEVKPGRPRKYKTNKSLLEAVNGYFTSISRTRVLTEKVIKLRPDEKGQLQTVYDKYGHEELESVPVKNDLGEPIRVTEFLIPPTVGGLCEHLGISRETWSDYCDSEAHPEFSDTTAYARGRMRGWNETELLVRKEVKGIIFNLENNYGYKNRLEVMGGNVEEFLKHAGSEAGVEY